MSLTTKKGGIKAFLRRAETACFWRTMKTLAKKEENTNVHGLSAPVQTRLTSKKMGLKAYVRKAGKVCSWRTIKTMMSKTLTIKKEKSGVDGGASDEEEHYNITSEMDELKKLSVVGL